MVKEIVRSNAHTKHDDDITAPLSSDIVNPLAGLVKTVCVCYVIHHHCNCAVADVAEKQIPSYGFMSRNYQTATIKDIELISRISTVKIHLGMRLRNLSCPAVSHSCSRTVRSFNWDIL